MAIGLALVRWYPESLVGLLIAASALLHPPVVLAPGPVAGVVQLTTDILDSTYGSWAKAMLGPDVVFLDLPTGPPATVGAVLEITGTATGESAARFGRPIPIVKVRSYSIIDESTGGYVALGNAIRSAVQDRLLDGSEERGLLAGFLVGDVSDLSGLTMDSMRAAGLSHFVAVSGSNVVLYLGVVAAITFPLGINTRLRAGVGLASLPIFVVATRFEASVLRAAAMAALVLLGRLLGLALEAWQVVATGVTILMIWDPWLISSVGFQLSVAATCGVIAGARWPIRRGRTMRALVVTLGAQLAVAPLLLIHFGTVPLLSPLTNLICAPMVTFATLMTVPALIGFTPALVPSGIVAGWVIDIADAAAGWPQLGGVAFFLFAVTFGLLMVVGRRRPEIAMVVGALVVLVSVVAPGHHLDAGQVAVLDVGQGDSILLAGGDERYVLVDGGPDPSVLMDRLRAFGVRRVEVVVLSHVHADHATGLQALFGRVPIGEIWLNVEPHETPASLQLIAMAGQYGVPIRQVGPGDHLALGALGLEVIAPLRRYASPNDQSIVLQVAGRHRRMLLTGDIEVFAQEELFGVRTDILKVPHQGAATSDADWLESLGAETAIISVGPNDFGHPALWVIDLLESSGADVFRTDRDGTVIVDLGE